MLRHVWDTTSWAIHIVCRVWHWLGVILPHPPCPYSAGHLFPSPPSLYHRSFGWFFDKILPPRPTLHHLLSHTLWRSTCISSLWLTPVEISHNTVLCVYPWFVVPWFIFPYLSLWLTFTSGIPNGPHRRRYLLLCIFSLWLTYIISRYFQPMADIYYIPKIRYTFTSLYFQPMADIHYISVFSAYGWHI